jgi:hypothetical protein
MVFSRKRWCIYKMQESEDFPPKQECPIVDFGRIVVPMHSGNSWTVPTPTISGQTVSSSYHT